MAQINEYALNAVRSAGLTGLNIAAHFEQMAHGTQAVGSSGGMFILNYIDPKQLPEEGELIPIITLSLKPFTAKRQPAQLPAQLVEKPEEKPEE